MIKRANSSPLVRIHPIRIVWPPRIALSEGIEHDEEKAREGANRVAARRRLLRGVCVFVLILAAYYAFAATEIYDDHVFELYLAINTLLST